MIDERVHNASYYGMESSSDRHWQCRAICFKQQKNCVRYPFCRHVLTACVHKTQVSPTYHFHFHCHPYPIFFPITYTNQYVNTISTNKNQITRAITIQTFFIAWMFIVIFVIVFFKNNTNKTHCHSATHNGDNKLSRIFSNKLFFVVIKVVFIEWESSTWH